MKLRYQMRGLGIGIIVTALMMGVVKGEKVPLSDAEIRIRAMELGMVESDSRKLSDIPGTTTSTDEQQSPEEPAGEGDPSLPLDESSQPSSEESSQPPSGESLQPSSEESSQPPSGGESSPSGESAQEDGGQQDSQSVVFTIESGSTSSDVCRQLQELGLVEDADGFEAYLYQMDYSRSIRAGSFEIARGTGAEEIARIITGK